MMNWRNAFLSQAQSDFAMFAKLNRPDVPYCHRLHYFQMATEKLAKAFLSNARSNLPPAPTHMAFVRALQTLKGDPGIRKGLGFSDAAAFTKFINSLLDTARRIEQLAPSSANFVTPNPEYPWRDSTTQEIQVPADFSFNEFNVRRAAQFEKLDWLMRKLLKLLDS